MLYYSFLHHVWNSCMQEHCKYLDTVAWNTLLKIIIAKYSKLAERIGPCILEKLLYSYFTAKVDWLPSYVHYVLPLYCLQRKITRIRLFLPESYLSCLFKKIRLVEYVLNVSRILGTPPDSNLLTGHNYSLLEKVSHPCKP